jgi:hypothetical protein
MNLVLASSGMVCVRAPQHIAGSVHLPSIHMYPKSLAWVVCTARVATFQEATRSEVGVCSRHCYNKHVTCSQQVS